MNHLTTSIVQSSVPGVDLDRCPILKFMSDFYVTDICTSDLCPFFKFSNQRLPLKLASTDVIISDHGPI
jgi:hypothetical protein